MREYFHWSPVSSERRRKNLLLCAAAFCAEVCVAAFFVLIFNFCTVPDRGVIFRMLAVIGGTLLAGMIFCFVTGAVFDRRIRRRSRYTYLDLQLRGMVYSAYAGEYRVGGERMMIRDLYYVPFGSLASVTAEKRSVALSGRILHYCMNSDDLGYHVRNGDFEFDHPYLNIGGYTVEEQLRIPNVFGSVKRAADSIGEAKRRFDALPAPKPHVFREADYIRRRPRARVLPESFDYSREWKNIP